MHSGAIIDVASYVCIYCTTVAIGYNYSYIRI